MFCEYTSWVIFLWPLFNFCVENSQSMISVRILCHFYEGAHSLPIFHTLKEGTKEVHSSPVFIRMLYRNKHLASLSKGREERSTAHKPDKWIKCTKGCLAKISVPSPSPYFRKWLAFFFVKECTLLLGLHFLIWRKNKYYNKTVLWRYIIM